MNVNPETLIVSARRDRMLRRFSDTAAPNSPRHSIRSRPSGFSLHP